ncbi:MAG: tetratricopeptide repeat protein [Magnetococcales bacterium]|nr:tetratricopeptide repeat protein [Magnetococcales bacterium]
MKPLRFLATPWIVVVVLFSGGMTVWASPLGAVGFALGEGLFSTPVLLGLGVVSLAVVLGLLVKAAARLRLAEAARLAEEKTRRRKAAIPTGFPPQPPTLPPNNLPYPRNPLFAGRAELLEYVGRILGQERRLVLSQSSPSQAGGGKTQMALEYAFRFAARYQVIWWVRARSRSSIAGDLSALAVQLKLNAPTLAEGMQNALTWLNHHPNWLVIFDGVGEPKEARPYFPTGPGHLLITSRHNEWGVWAEVCKVDALPQEETARFFLQRTSQNDGPASQELSREIGGMPGPMELARAFVTETRMPLHDYLNLLKSEKSRLPPSSAASPAASPAAMATCALTLRKVNEVVPAGGDVFKLLAFLAPEMIPLELPVQFRDALPKSLFAVLDGAAMWPKAVRELERFGLVEQGGGDAEEHTLSLSSAVQEAVRARMDENERRAWAKAAVQMMDAAFPFDWRNAESWTESGLLLPHVLMAVDHAEQAQVVSDETPRLLARAGDYLVRQGRWDEALGLHQRALRLTIAQWGEDHLETASRLHALGRTLVGLKEPGEAEIRLRRSLTILAAHQQEESSVAAEVMETLAELRQEVGDLAEAKILLEAILSIRRDHPEEGGMALMEAHTRLGDLLNVLKDWQSARHHYARALNLCEHEMGPEHPEVAERMAAMGRFLRGGGDLKGAYRYYQRAMEITQQHYGDDHPKVALRMNNMGLLLRELGDREGAVRHFERAVEIYRLALPGDDPRIGTVKRNLAAARGN